MEELDKLLNEFKQSLIQNKNDSVSNSFQYQITVNGDVYSIAVSFVDYAKYLEHGTYDYRIDEKDLLKWINISKSLPTPTKLPKGHKRLPGEKKGIQPRHIIADTVDQFQLINKLYGIVGKSLTKSFSDELNKIK